MTDPTNPDSGTGNAAHADSTSKTTPSDPSLWSRCRKPAIWLSLGVLATAGVSSIALARYGGWHDGRGGGRYGYSERYEDRYARGGRYGSDDGRPYARRDDNDGPRERYRDSDREIGGFGFRDFDFRFTHRVLTDMGATDEQRTKIRVIVRAARNDIEEIRDRVPNTRKASIDLLAKPTVDRAALEVLRAERQKVYDELSKRMTQATADVAETLSPEQRANLVTMVARRSDDRHR